MRYAIVPGPGMYGSGSRVRALRVCGDLDTAARLATQWTRGLREIMSHYGGTSGRYRVIETDARDRRDACWLGHDLDRIPEVA